MELLEIWASAMIPLSTANIILTSLFLQFKIILTSLSLHFKIIIAFPLLQSRIPLISFLLYLHSILTSGLCSILRQA